MRSRHIQYNPSRARSVNFGLLSELEFFNNALHEASGQYFKDRIHNLATPVAQGVYGLIVGGKNLERNKRIKDYMNQAASQRSALGKEIRDLMTKANEVAGGKYGISDIYKLRGAIADARNTGNEELADRLSVYRDAIDQAQYKIDNTPKLIEKFKDKVMSDQGTFDYLRNMAGENLRASFRYGPEFDAIRKPPSTLAALKNIYAWRLMPNQVKDIYMKGRALAAPLQFIDRSLYGQVMGKLDLLRAPFTTTVDIATTKIPGIRNVAGFMDRNMTAPLVKFPSIYDKINLVNPGDFQSDANRLYQTDSVSQLNARYS